MRPPIVLMTDYGSKDPYVGIVKGVLAERACGCPVLDLTHGIEPQNIVQASAFLQMSARYFPKGTVFLCVVDPGVGTSREILCVRTANYYFLAPDNGLLTEVLQEEKPLEIRSIHNNKLFLVRTPSLTFHGRDIFAPIAAAIARSRKPAEFFKRIGPTVSRYMQLPSSSLRVSSREILARSFTSIILEMQLRIL